MGSLWHSLSLNGQVAMFLVMKTETFAKLFFLISFTGLIMYVLLAFYSFHTAYTTVSDYENHHTLGMPNLKYYLSVNGLRKDEDLKYILIWTTYKYKETTLKEGQGPFVYNNCTFINCYLTTNQILLQGYNQDFDAVIMNVDFVRQWKQKDKPQYRTRDQKYIFFSMKSADEAPICVINTDNYFNWTWTYRLQSNISTPFIEVTDLEGKMVAPKQDVKWIEHTAALSEKIMEKLTTKKYAVAWIMLPCHTRKDRLGFAKKLQTLLKEMGLQLDIYGCYQKDCPKEGCLKAIERDYYFYLAYEASDDEDFVTQEVLKAYDNYAVPIVRGGADYRLFLPENSYLSTKLGSLEKLAAVINYSIRNPSTYHKFHSWRNYYKIQKYEQERGYCDLCEMMNNKFLYAKRSSYGQFRKWWFKKPLMDRCYPKGAEEFAEVLSYLNSTKRRRQ